VPPIHALLHPLAQVSSPLALVPASGLPLSPAPLAVFAPPRGELSGRAAHILQNWEKAFMAFPKNKQILIIYSPRPRRTSAFASKGPKAPLQEAPKSGAFQAPQKVSSQGTSAANSKAQSPPSRAKVWGFSSAPKVSKGVAARGAGHI
jgi:hypothetical protein